MDTNTIQEMLVKEMEEHNEHARVLFQVYVAWFTFFITVLMAAMATGIKASLDRGKVRFPWTVYAVALLFGVQLIIGIWVSCELRNEFVSIDQRVDTITTNLVAIASQTNATLSNYVAPRSAIPKTMAKALFLAIITLVSNVFFWGGLVATISWWRKKGTAVAPLQVTE